jgi:hypothetical protein
MTHQNKHPVHHKDHVHQQQLQCSNLKLRYKKKKKIYNYLLKKGYQVVE